MSDGERVGWLADSEFDMGSFEPFTVGREQQGSTSGRRSTERIPSGPALTL